MSQSEIQAVLEAHGKWLRSEAGGVRADLSSAYLSGADLSRAYLSSADLSSAYLSSADLSRANLTGADLSRADLSGANLCRADLTRANLTGANLTGANLRRANLRRANLTGANLTGANLSGADLSGAYLSSADLSGATNAPLLASIGWSDHGECGRTLTAMMHDSTGAEPMYRCGCFWGDEAKLRQYIADGDEHLRESRTEALDIVSGLMARMIARRKSA